MKKLSILLFLMILGVYLYGQDTPVYPVITAEGRFLGISQPLRDLPVITEDDWTGMKNRAEQKRLNPKLQKREYPFASTALPKGADPVWQNSMGFTENSTELIQSFDGQNSPYYPPDCNGAAGPSHYVQTINTTFAVYSKTGTLLAGPTNLNTLFSGLPGATYNDGDPIVLYDEQANRWLIAEFSVSGSNDYMLIAISTTSDPTGTWYKYSFDVADMPDYPKFGVWQDGYYMGTNNPSGADIYVFERSVMLIGGTNPKMAGFDNPWRPTTIDGFVCVPPVDNDGSFAPTGTPGIFIAFNDDAIGGGSDQLWIYELTVNWNNTSASTFVRSQQINVAPFDSNFGNTWNNITQQGTSQKVDAIPQVIMNVPQYRNFGSYQTLVACHTVDVDGTDHAGIRWYELRKTSSTWTVRQQATYAPDAHNRWMGSIAMNAAGEIALGYSISSSTLYPGIRYTGQTEGSYAAGNSIMDVPEVTIHTGQYSQTGSNRWGDYSLMCVDPSDDETFWFTTQYIGSGGSRKTKIASFQIGPMAPTASFTASTTLPCLGQTVTFTDQSTAGPTSWQWTFTPNTITFVNGTSATSQNPQVQFNAYGNYTVSLTATNSVGSNTNTQNNYIQVNEANADFTANPTTVVVGYSTTFTDASTCAVNSWSWDFGSGASPATASTQGPHIVTYTTTGQKNISLTVNGNNTKTKNNYINVISDNINMQNGTIYTCSGNFYDPGGPSANYTNNLDHTLTFYPGTPGNSLKVTFTSFSLESSSSCNYDYLKIYNGPTSASPLIGTYCGTNSPGIVTANNADGALTFVFHSDASVTAAGWVATIACVSTVTVPNPANLVATATSTSQIDLTWALNANNDNVLLAWSPTTTFGTPVNGASYTPGSSLPGGGTVLYAGSNTAYSHTGLNPATTYYYKAFSYNTSNIYSSGITANATTQAVTLAVSPSNQNVPAAAGTTTFSVSSNGNWTASSNQTWCTVTPSGTGNGILVATYTENTAITPRIASITVTAAGAPPVTVTVTQDGAAPTVSVTPSNYNVSSQSGFVDFTVTSNTSWTAVSNQTWCTVSPPSGNGNGVLTAVYEENTTLNQRVATITVSAAGATPASVTVTQAAAGPYLNVEPQNQNVAATAGSTSYNVSSNTSWTAVSNQTWCSVTPSGAGNGALIATYTENTSTSQRIAEITVSASGLTPVVVTLTQAGATPTLSVIPDNQNVSASAGTTTFDVSSNTSWNAVSNVSWCTVNPTSGSGNGILTATYEENTSVQSRVAFITVSATGAVPVTVTVSQAGAAPWLNITPQSQTVSGAAGTSLFDITSNTSWIASSDAPWCNVTPAGNGNGTLQADYQENVSTETRTANITVTPAGGSPQLAQLVQLPLGVGIPEEESMVHIFPNPSHGRFNITAQGNRIFQIEISLYEASGKKIYSASLEGKDRYIIDLGKAPAGVYTAIITVDGQTFYRKVVIQ